MTTPEQDVLIENWVAALRSGDYQQCTDGNLHNGSGFCCLGVAGKLIGISEEQLQHLENKSEDNYGNIRNAYGLRTTLGNFKDADGLIVALTTLNDTGTSFSEIADIIESRPEGLFE